MIVALGVAWAVAAGAAPVLAAPVAAAPVLAALAPASAPETAWESAIARLAAELARAAARIAPPERTVVGVEVEAPAMAALADAIEARLVAALAAAGFRGAFPASRAAAEGEGADAHLFVALELDEELAAAGELAAVRVNFFTGRPTGPGGAVSAAVPADREARLLARAGPARPAGGLEVSRWAAPALAPLGIAAGDLDGDGRAEVALLDATAIRVLGPDGVERAAWPLPAPGPDARPVRDLAGGIAILAGVVRWSVPALDRAGTLRLEAGVLAEESGGFGSGPAPLAAGAAGLLAAAWRPGTNGFGPQLRVAGREADAGGPCVAAAAAPGSGTVAFAVARDDGTVAFLDPGLQPSAAPLAGAGAAVALADLDGDGTAEAVVTSPAFDAPDRVRVFSLAPGAPPALRFESADLPVRFLAGAAADLDADGRDEALLAGPAAGGGAAIFVVREARR